MKKSKRKQFHYYVTDEEYIQIQNLASRIGKPESAVVRICVLAVANTPLLEYVFDDGVLLKPSSKQLSLQSKSLKLINKVLTNLERQGIVVDLDELIDEEDPELEVKLNE